MAYNDHPGKEYIKHNGSKDTLAIMRQDLEARLNLPGFLNGQHLGFEHFIDNEYQENLEDSYYRMLNKGKDSEAIK